MSNRLDNQQFPCYIINVELGDKIEFYMIPDEVTDSNSANYENQSIRGRSAPYKMYNDSGPRVVTFTAQLHSNYSNDNSITFTVNKLRALEYPEYNGSKIIAPSAFLRIGDIAMRCVITNVTVSWKKPIKFQTYMYAEVSITAEEVVDSPFSASDIKEGRYYSKVGLRGVLGSRVIKT